MLKQFASSRVKSVRSVTCEVLALLGDFLDISESTAAFVDLMSLLAGDSTSTIRRRVPELIGAYVFRFDDGRERALLSARFSILVRDPSPHVRLSAATFLLKLSDSFDAQTRLVMIEPALKLLIADSHECVRKVVMTSLGALIAGLGPLVDPDLLQRYCALLMSADSDVAYGAAFAFPGVALTLGREKWPDLKMAFEAVVQSAEFRIRRTLSFGLASFAPMMSPDELLRYSVGFLNDMSEVAIGVIASLHQLVGLVGLVERRAELLFCLVDPIQKYPKWRTRLQVSQQLRYCSEAFERTVLLNSAAELLRDQVAVVRNDAVLSFVCLMKEDDFGGLRELWESENWVDRFVVASMFTCFTDEVAEVGVEVLGRLANDPVANVRIAVSRCIGSVIGRISVGEGEEKLRTAMNRLLEDSDPDVRVLVG
jgi:hypothetical protein